MVSKNEIVRRLVTDITLHDLTFVPFIYAEDIRDKVSLIADNIKREYVDKKPLIIVVMNGAFMFAADLVRALNIPCDIDFINIKSYEGITSSGQANIEWPAHIKVKGRHIIVVEDIIDTGLTMAKLIPIIDQEGAASIAVTAIFIKPDAIAHPIEVQYPGFKIPNNFIVGYGLDYNGLGRNYQDVYTLKK
jgi:hypoxanthine phosphoribosyltransferase